MASDRPWFKCFPSDFLAGTADLNQHEGWVYTHILMRIYDDAAPIKNDAKMIARRCNMDSRRVSAVLAGLIEDDKLFIDDNGDIDNKRARNERINVAIRTQNARVSALTRWEKSNENNKSSMRPHENRIPDSHATRDQKLESKTVASNSVTTAARTRARDSEAIEGATLLNLEEKKQLAKDAAEVIAAFDSELVAVFGEALRNRPPNPADLAEAKAMLKAGAALETCRFVFSAVFAKMKQQNRAPPSVLKYMRNPVAEAVADPLSIPIKANGAGKPISAEDQQEDRVESYRLAIKEGREPFWRDEAWGPRPEAGREK